MKSSKKKYQPNLGKLTFIIAISLLFLVQCKESRVDDFGFQEEINEHFGGMNYKEIVFAENVSSSNKADVDYQSGDGTLKGENGNELNYKWAFLTGENGDLLTVYIGTSQVDSTTVVELTRGEARQRLRNCSRKADAEEMFACMDEVMAQVENDCDFSMSIEECREACWLTPNSCIGQ